MSRVWGYARGAVLPDFMTVEEQTRQIQEYATQKLAGYEYMNVTVDALLGARPAKFLDRPNAAKLNMQMQQGDHIIVARMDRGWRTTEDFLSCYDAWTKRGICVHVLDFDLHTPSLEFGILIKALRAVDSWARLAKVERRKEVHAAKGYLKEPYFVRRKLGWKYITVGQTPHGYPIRKLVPEEHERELMREVVGWIDKGWKWQDVADLFTNRGERKRFKTGRVYSWTAGMVGHAYKVAKKMMEAGEL
jgi:DNA invertase Pin-like site-specific DNA recombinase